MSDLGLEMPAFFDPSEAPGPGVFDGDDIAQASIFGGGMGMVDGNPLLGDFAPTAKAPPMQRPPPPLSTVAVPGTTVVGDGKPQFSVHPQNPSILGGRPGHQDRNSNINLTEMR